jgi:hypothetical protein
MTYGIRYMIKLVIEHLLANLCLIISKKDCIRIALCVLHIHLFNPLLLFTVCGTESAVGAQ